MTRRRSRGGSKRARKAHLSQGFEQAPFARQKQPYAAVSILDDAAIDKIHHASLEILSTIGIRVLEPQAREIMSEHGAEVDEQSLKVKL